MKTVGLFEAKTHLSEICQEVLKRGEGVLITKRGKPMVKIVPAERRWNVWEARQLWVEENGPIEEDFRTALRTPADWKNPLAE